MDSRLARLQALSQKQTRSQSREKKSLPGRQRQRIQAEIIFTKEPIKPILFKKEEDETPLPLQNLALQDSIINDEETIPLEKHYEQSESEEEEEEEKVTIPLLRPVFVPKDNRNNMVKGTTSEDTKGEAHELLIQYVRREYEASTTKANTEELVFDPLTVDDTDDIDMEAEVQAWRLRELLRIKRDRQMREQRERERIELERIRNMSEEERRLLDEEKTREWMSQPKGEMRFMQKYYHKGAFFMGDEKGDGGELMKRDYQQATGEDANANREVLPEVKQVKNFGKKGRTKWTHLVGEDTTAFDYGWGQKKNDMNYKLVSKMGGMRGHLDNPAASSSSSKRAKK